MSSKIKHCQKIDALIRKKATGSPGELARKVGLSETYVKRLIGFMRVEYKMPITYTLQRGYIYRRKGQFYVGWIDEE